MDLSSSSLRASWLQALEDGTRMKDGFWAVGQFSALYTSLDPAQQRSLRAEVEQWTATEEDSNRPAAEALLDDIDRQEARRASRWGVDRCTEQALQLDAP